MIRDYKSSLRSQPVPEQTGAKTWRTGLVIIALCAGITTTAFSVKRAGITHWLGGHSSAVNDPIEPTPALPTPIAASKSANKTIAKTSDRFDFYYILSGRLNDKSLLPARTADAGVAAASSSAPAGGQIQLGTFQNEIDADNLKAKLALMGVNANIQTTEVSGKGMLHKLYISPDYKAEDLVRIREQLRGSGIKSVPAAD